MKARLIDEQPTHYTLHDGQSRFRVPKFGLSEDMHAKIRGMAGGGRLTGKAVDSTETEEGDGDDVVRAKRPAPLPPPSDAAYQASVDAANATKQREAQHRPQFGYHPRPAPGAPVVQRAHGGAIPGYADGGEAYAPYDPSALEPRRDRTAVVYESKFPTPGSVPVPVNTGAGGGAPDTGAGGGPGWYGPGTISRPDMGSGGTEGGASGNQMPPAEAAAMKVNAPTAATPTRLPPGVVERGREPVAAAPKPAARAPMAAPATQAAPVESEDQAAVRELMRLEGERGKAEGIAAGERAKALAQTARDEADTRARAQLATSEMMAKSKALTDEMKTVDTSVDPGRFWASRSTGEKVLGAIGLALGSFSPDGVNRAAQILGQAVDRDIDAQKAEHAFRLQRGEKALQGLHSAYALQHQIFGDELAATAATKASTLEMLAAKVEAEEQKFNTPMAQEKLRMLGTQLRQTAETHQADVVDKAAGAGLKVAETKRAYAEANKAATGSGAGNKELQQQLASGQTSIDTIDKIRKSLAATRGIGSLAPIGGQTLLTGAAQKFGPLANTLETQTYGLLTQLKEDEKLGAISKGDFELLERQIGDPSAFWTGEGSKDAKLNAIEDQIRTAMANQKAAAGVR